MKWRERIQKAAEAARKGLATPDLYPDANDYDRCYIQERRPELREAGLLVSDPAHWNYDNPRFGSKLADLACHVFPHAVQAATRDGETAPAFRAMRKIDCILYRARYRQKRKLHPTVR